MSVPQLLYGGEKFTLDAEQVDDFLEKVSTILASENGAALVKVPLSRNRSMAVTVSREIPLAVAWPDGDGKPKEAFVL